MHFFLPVVAWLVALVWIIRVGAAHFGLPTVPNLLLAEHDLSPVGGPTITVIVPGRNEEKDFKACVESLLAQDYPGLRVIAVDDRSTDRSGEILDLLAAAHPAKLRVLHLSELPSGWLGKTHAMALAAREAETDFLLFTDADIFFEPAAIRLALANAVSTGADHFVIVPTTLIRRWDEAGLLAFFQILGTFAVRLWKVADPRARDAVGIGAFNLIRTEAYRKIGGFESFPMEVVEDLGLARRVKWAGLRQRVAFGRGLVSVHWAAGVRGLVNVMTKNMFSAFNFHVPLVVLACGWLVTFAILPWFLLAVPGCRLPALLALLATAWAYRLMAPFSGLSGWNVLLAPFGAMLFVYALLRSMCVTLWQGGVFWRGTFYSLAELRKNTVPLLRRS